MLPWRSLESPNWRRSQCACEKPNISRSSHHKCTNSQRVRCVDIFNRRDSIIPSCLRREEYTFTWRKATSYCSCPKQMGKRKTCHASLKSSLTYIESGIFNRNEGYLVIHSSIRCSARIRTCYIPKGTSFRYENIQENEGSSCNPIKEVNHSYTLFHQSNIPLLFTSIKSSF